MLAVGEPESFMMSPVDDVTPAQCADSLNTDPNTLLIDVRSRAEWAFVGLPVLDDPKRVLLQEWQQYPHMNVDPQFVDQLSEKISDLNLNQSTALYFICRSGARSLAAANAMVAAGFENSFNVAGGFEGDCDANGHRGQVNGWKADGLSWRQN